MRMGYLRCLHAAAGGDASVRPQAGLIAQRLAAYSGLRMFHYYRAYREVPPAAWRSLHEVYAQAEKARRGRNRRQGLSQPRRPFLAPHRICGRC